MGGERRGGCESEGVRRPESPPAQERCHGEHKDGGRGGGASEEPGREIYHFILTGKQKSTWHFTGKDQTGLRDLTVIAGRLFVPADPGGGEIKTGGVRSLQVSGSQPGERVFAAQ